MRADWPTTGAIPVFRGDEQAPEFAGYTTIVLMVPVELGCRASPFTESSQLKLNSPFQTIEPNQANSPRCSQSAESRFVHQEPVGRTRLKLCIAHQQLQNFRKYFLAARSLQRLPL